VVPSVTFELLYAFIIVRLRAQRSCLDQRNIASDRRPLFDCHPSSGKNSFDPRALGLRPTHTRLELRLFIGNNKALGLGKSGHIRHDCAA